MRVPQWEGVDSGTKTYLFDYYTFYSNMLLSVFPADIVLNNRITIVLNKMGLTLKIYCTKKRFRGHLVAKYLKKPIDSWPITVYSKDAKVVQY